MFFPALWTERKKLIAEEKELDRFEEYLHNEFTKGEQQRSHSERTRSFAGEEFANELLYISSHKPARDGANRSLTVFTTQDERAECSLASPLSCSALAMDSSALPLEQGARQVELAVTNTKDTKATNIVVPHRNERCKARAQAVSTMPSASTSQRFWARQKVLKQEIQQAEAEFLAAQERIRAEDKTRAEALLQPPL